jgi:hypothetical protein
MISISLVSSRVQLESAGDVELPGVGRRRWFGGGTFGERRQVPLGNSRLREALRESSGSHEVLQPGDQSLGAPGLAAGGYFERLAPGDAYLTVLLTPDSGALYVEISAPDGRDHKDDTIAVAHRVLDQLH